MKLLSSEQLKSIAKISFEKLKESLEKVFNKLDHEKIVRKANDKSENLPENECEKNLLSVQH